jgi:hypothetical protein
MTTAGSGEGHEHEAHREETAEHFHPHLHPHFGEDVCERCGSNEHVHKALCRKCHELLLGQGAILGPEHQEHPHQANPAPLHSPPWRRRGA